MGILKNLVTSLHQQTKRNYIERMQNEKVKCSKFAMKFEKEYWGSSIGELVKVSNFKNDKIIKIAT